MSVAQDYPARTDADGRTWYRPVRDKGMDLSQWGWTSNPAMAHPDYAEAATLCALPANVTAHDRAAVLEFQQELARRSAEPNHVRYPTTGGHPPQEEPLTELMSDGTADTYRRSEVCGFPLPPFPEQINVDTDGWNRYKLPSPTTNKLTAYTRATTVAKVTSDDYNLVQWFIREKVRATLECQSAWEAGIESDQEQARAAAYWKYMEAVQDGKNRDINKAIDVMHDLCGGAEAREHGGAVHDWIAELDMGKVLKHQVPEQYQVHVTAYQEAMARAGLIAIPWMTERLVLHTATDETIAGRLDGVAFCVETGEWHVIDRKTSKTLDFSALEFGVQVAGVYAGAELLLKEDRSGWDPMPEVNKDIAFIIHVPSDQPERSQVVPIAIGPGQYALGTAVQVRAERRMAKEVFFGQTYPVPSKAALRYVAARQRLQDVRGLEDAQEIMAEYEDVWDDDLSEFGAQCFDLLHLNTDTEEK